MGITIVLLASCGQSPDPVANAKAQIALQQQQQAAERAQERQDALEPYQRAAAVAWWLFLAAVPLVAVGVALDAYRVRRRPLVRPDHAGQLPVPRAMIDRGELADAMVAALAQWHRTQQLAAQRPIVDKLTITETRAPRVAAVETENLPALGAPAILPLPVGTIDLAELVQTWRPSVAGITLVVGPGGVPYRVHARDLCHVALAGATGGGKSNIMRLLLAQLLAAGAHVVLADPHFTLLDVECGDDWRPIAQRLHMAPAVTAGDIRHMLAWLATDELPQRLERRRRGEPVGVPLFLAIDELPSIVKDVPEAPEHLGRLLREARKVGIFLVSSAQDFLVKTIGGAGAVRDCYRTAFYVGGDAQTARVLLDVSGRVDDAQLGQGLAFLRSRVTPTAEIVRVPYASNQAIYDLLPGRRLDAPIDIVPAGGRPDGSHVVANGNVDARASQSPALQSAETARIVALFREGLDVAGIVREVHGVTSKQGRAYQERSAEVQGVLRAVLGGSSNAHAA